MRPPYSTLTPTHIYTYAASLLEPCLTGMITAPSAR
jgi:hypothetical protein